MGLLASRAWAPARAGTRLDWPRFLDQLSALAEAQFSDAWDTEAYVEDVAVLMRAADADRNSKIDYNEFIDFAYNILLHLARERALKKISA